MYNGIRSSEKILTMIKKDKTAAGALDDAEITEDALKSIKLLEKAYVLACLFISDNLNSSAVVAHADFPECSGDCDTREYWQ